jgi:AbrB family looped-hinge helix DNA binding protein
MIYSTTVTSKGQVTLPAAFRRKLGIKPGERLKVELQGDSVVVHKDDWLSSLKKLQAKNRTYLKKHNVPILADNELDNAIDDASQQAALARQTLESE